MVVKIKDLSFEFDGCDSECAGKYEEAIENVSKIIEINNAKLSLKNKIVKACKVIYNGIDTIFGAGTSKKIFGDTNNIREASEVWKDIVTQISKHAAEEAELIMTDEHLN